MAAASSGRGGDGGRWASGRTESMGGGTPNDRHRRQCNAEGRRADGHNDQVNSRADRNRRWADVDEEETYLQEMRTRAGSARAGHRRGQDNLHHQPMDPTDAILWEEFHLTVEEAIVEALQFQRASIPQRKEIKILLLLCPRRTELLSEREKDQQRQVPQSCSPSEGGTNKTGCRGAE